MQQVRWKVITEAWKLAKESFPNASNLFVMPPAHLSGGDDCPVVDMSNPDKPLGFMSFTTEPMGGGKSAINMRLGDKTSQVLIDPEGQPPGMGEVKVASTITPLPTGEFDEAQLAARYPGEDISQKAGVLAAAPKKAGAAEEKWLSQHGYKMAKKKPTYRANARVRIQYEDSRDFGECGRIMGRKETDDGDWYLVLVDGSGQPRWFNEKALKPDEAGKTP